MTVEQAVEFLKERMPPGQTFCVQKQIWRNVNDFRTEYQVSLFKGANLPVQTTGKDLRLTVQKAMSDYPA